jgi:hypothetical protein
MPLVRVVPIRGRNGEINRKTKFVRGEKRGGGNIELKRAVSIEMDSLDSGL